MCTNFQAQLITLTVWPKFAQKWILGSEFQKTKSGFGISSSKFPNGPILSQDRQLWIFGPKFGKIAWYMQYWGSNNVEGVAENRVEAQMIWVEVEMGWVEGVGWSWVHGIVTPNFKNTFQMN